MRQAIANASGFQQFRNENEICPIAVQSKPLAELFAMPKSQSFLLSKKPPHNFLPTILGPEMAAPILWVPGKIALFLQGNLHAHKILRFSGGVFWGVFRALFLGGGGECRFYFYGRGELSDFMFRGCGLEEVASDLRHWEGKQPQSQAIAATAVRSDAGLSAGELSTNLSENSRRLWQS